MNTWIAQEEVVNFTAAVQRPVQAKLRMMADTYKWRAEVHLAQHRDTGNAEIQMRRDTQRPKLDWWIDLVDEHASAIEDGYYARNGRFVQGLNIIKGLL